MSSGGEGEEGEREGLSCAVPDLRICLSFFLVRVFRTSFVSGKNHPSFGIRVKAWKKANPILILCRKLDETLLRKVRSSDDGIFAATLDR